MNTKKLIGINIFIVLFAYLVPVLILNSQHDFRLQGIIQSAVFVTLFFGSIAGLVINFKNFGSMIISRKWPLLFGILSLVVIIYSGTILYLMFALRNGINY